MASSPVADDRLVVLDTDVLHDPDDAITLVVAARTIRRLVVVTADEVLVPAEGGLRARGARAMLDALGRPDVPVITGFGSDGHRLAMDYETLMRLPYPPMIGLVDTIVDLCEQDSEPLRWIGCGPLTNLAEILTSAPHVAERVELVQMGGWLDPARYRDPSRASHNLRIDPRAAGVVLRMCRHPRLVLSEHTGVPAIRVTPDWLLYQRLTAPDAPQWARIPAANFAIWCRSRSGSWMHDPLTLTAALDLGFVTFRDERILLGEDGRLSCDPNGHAAQVSTEVDYAGFVGWLEEVTATTPQPETAPPGR
ncbi:nucleoside hydrolase [Nocardia sp. CDC159]|uniref:Nucleoside hydrolase n=1 Tax=Nocardia pulmonis TaxID=2951408 RepID=A0A9X2IY06_9NOCA|nr:MULTISPECIES: nucleoside hydrolase [Nocardia]MCM6774445.1 nucleoside hydrolase [Nocardia pulmonis]MCM6787489.1 nucleoside hydrolase [Nocardia sp. CDC159]